MKTVAFFLALLVPTVLWAADLWAADNRQVDGDWSSQYRTEFTEAFTGNTSGSTFGMLCTTASCVFYVDTNNSCEPNSVVPILVNAFGGSVFVSARCYEFDVPGKQKRWLATFPTNDDLMGSFRASDYIGFAFPLRSGEFKASRFSGSGFTAATSRAIQGALSLKPKAPGADDKKSKTGDRLL